MIHVKQIIVDDWSRIWFDDEMMFDSHSQGAEDVLHELSARGLIEYTHADLYGSDANAIDEFGLPDQWDGTVPITEEMILG